MKNGMLSVFVGILIGVAGYGQLSQSNRANYDELVSIPQESVYVQFNESLLFSGEHLLYKLYCLDNSKRRLSQVSKMGYISLVDKDGKAVFTHKIRLDKGSGYGDFFVPTSIPTGSYKLLGYSEWMKNFGHTNFFQTDIHIINPYQALPEEHLEQVLDSSQQAIPTFAHTSAPKTSATSNQLVSVVLEKNQLGKREKLQIKIEAKDSEIAQGNYAVSIRKVDEISAPQQVTSTMFFTDFTKRAFNAKVSNTTTSVLPELRGEVISGTIVNKETKLPVAEQRISLSLPGEQFLLKVVTSNDQGQFRFTIDQEYDNVNGAVQILSENWDLYDINMDGPHGNYEKIKVTDFKLSEEMKDYVLRKSIQNQIENGYRQVKQDAVVPASHEQPYYRNFPNTYNLDEYTRFNSIPETIVEVVDHVAVRKLNDGNRVFEIRPEEGFTDQSLLPMVFVDGLFIKKHEDFMDFSAKKIKSISFSRNKVILGPQIFQGVLSFKTIEGGFYNSFYTPHIVNLDLFKPQSKKQYFNQTYEEDDDQGRIPDFRHQLLWEPNLDLSEGSKTLILYTSDVPGAYELTLEGFSSTGNPVSVNRELIVR